MKSRDGGCGRAANPQEAHLCSSVFICGSKPFAGINQKKRRPKAPFIEAGGPAIFLFLLLVFFGFFFFGFGGLCISLGCFLFRGLRGGGGRSGCGGGERRQDAVLH